METADIQAIQARLRDIIAQIEKLRGEAEELETAVRVFRRFAEPNGAAGEPKLGPPRPEGLPSLLEMTSAVLRDAVGAGKSGLTSAEIVEAIGKRYWPGVKPQQILPPIYGFSKRGRLRKNAKGMFSLPQE